MKKLALVAAVLMIAAACSSSDDGGGEETDPTNAPDTTSATETTQAPDTEADSASSDEPNEGASAGASFAGQGTATVVLNGETYYFGDAGFPAIQCLPDFFGVMMVALQRVDDSGAALDGGGSVQIVLLHEGTDPAVVDQLNEMSVNLDDLDQEWIADETDFDERELAPGTSQVDSVTFDGIWAIGSATLYEENSYWGAGGDPNAVETATATFEVACAEE